MLQQMSSPGALYGEVVRTEGRPCGDASSGASSDAADDFELPHCKIRRNYNCTKCTYYTQNPRAYLVHTRDVHFVKLKIFDCPNCLYASRHHQKLIRHVKMVHGRSTSNTSKVETDASAAADSVDHNNRMEDMLEEIEDIDDGQMEFDDNFEEHDPSEDVKGDDERMESVPGKEKRNFYSCDKCYYVTHIRARFTKHVKYHTMPMIKCIICDFQTPYKWNLDRHMKNHGGNGSFTCFVCNFTADLQQSMTVHEMNHHTRPPGGPRPGRRRNRVGASQAALADVPLPFPKDEEGSGDSSDMGLQYTEKDIVSCTSDSNDATASETNNGINLNEDVRSQSPNTSTDESKSQKQKKIPRPLPQLIPLNSSTPNQKLPTGEPPLKKFKESPNSESIDINLENKMDSLQSEVSFIPINNGPLNAKDTLVRKKNESFFDRLKERLLTETGENGSLVCKNCGFESKCLSEHSVHEKNCAPLTNRTALNTLLPSSSSTRCQNCRHRCKSSADLYIHMQTCKRSGKIEDESPMETDRQTDEKKKNQLDKEVEPHPMENVVFVWNNIHHEQGKFDTPLDISINDDSTLPDQTRSYECETVDENESMNLSPSQAVGKNVFKCPHCPFWASTASRFHVHIVGHLNKKPFECSLCKYKSNWRWDITKHIKLKSARDPEHNDAKVLMTDETGRRNYSKYSKFLAMPVVNENGESEFHYIDPSRAVDTSMEVDETFNDANDITNTNYEMQPLNLQTQIENKSDIMDIRDQDGKKIKKTLWKCKKCNYKDSSKEALLEHVREHARLDNGHEDPKNLSNKKPENVLDPADLAYRCGHCNQLSNWKHVIQRHCRLKHEGVIKVITTVKPKLDTSASTNETPGEVCTKCPYRTSDKKALSIHIQQHQPSTNSIFKCFFCPFFVKDEHDLIQHLQVHGVNDPEDYISKAVNCGSPLPELQSSSNLIHPCSTKRHKCTECPYETNSKSQYMYHEQFHRLPADTPYKCPECNYSVSKRHLLHQHLRVHGIIPKKSESEAELELMTSYQKTDNATDPSDINLDETPYVWVSAKNEFHKMFKCRYCSYVNSQKCKIPNHEKIHFYLFENSEIIIYKCLDCKFTCDNASKLAEHSKTHGEIYGRIYCPVEEDVPDEEQISKLRKVIELEKSSNMDNMSPRDDEAKLENRELKTLHFCQKCPARYFTESELKVHEKFHDLILLNKCKSCEFSVPEEDELILHNVVHSDEYHTKTKMLKFIHNVHPMYKEPRLASVFDQEMLEVTWIATKPMKINESVDTPIKKISEGKHVAKQYYCKECPAKFFKTSALNYHMALHGGEGDHKCKTCSYSVKNIGNLAKHELLHENEHKQSNCDYESNEDIDYKNVPLSGTDLFQRKTEAQKRVFTDKDKLVKPNDHFPPVLQADPQFGYLMHGNPEFIYPTYLKNGRQKEKRYKCHKCPSAFEKREQYKIHLSLHGSKQRYKCELCDYSVKYYANYVQHMRKHQMNDEAQAERKKSNSGLTETDCQEDVKREESKDHIKLAIKTMPKGIPRSDFQQFSLRDQQTLRLLQRRRSMANAGTDINTAEASPTKERKLHICLLCPYTNQRQDALNNHYKRHDDTDILNSGSHKCSYCDLVVVQSHFLREHLKTHFNHHKTHVPECFVANQDVSFTLKNLEDETKCTDLKLDFFNQNNKCNEDKIYVKIKTGELLVE